MLQSSTSSQSHPSATSPSSVDDPLLPLFPPLEPYHTARLPVDSLHTLFYQEYGNPDGLPVLFLHGGPGAGCHPSHARFFHPRHHRILLLDQRGSGQSTPPGEVRNNTLSDLVEDCEALRRRALGDGAGPWHCVLGGSWGSTLGLAYAARYPRSLRSLVLRGVCLLRPGEVDWIFGEDLNRAVGQEMIRREGDPNEEQGESRSTGDSDPRFALHALYDRLLSNDPVVRWEAARLWMLYEFQRMRRGKPSDDGNATTVNEVLTRSPSTGEWSFRDAQGRTLQRAETPEETIAKISHKLPTSSSDNNNNNNSSPFRPVRPVDIAAIRARSNLTDGEDRTRTLVPSQAILTCFYSVNDRAALNGIRLLEEAAAAAPDAVPCIAVHGALDPVCPVNNVLELAKVYPRMEVRIPMRAGHSMYDPAITNELIRATEYFAKQAMEGELRE